ETKLRDYIANNSSHTGLGGMMASSGGGERGILVLVDRDLDLIPMLSHAWTYAALVHDVLGMKSNRVSVTIQETGKPQKKSFDIDSADFFWLKNAGNP